MIKNISKLSFNIQYRVSKLKEAIEHNQNLFNHVSKKYKPIPSFYEGIDMGEIKNKRFEEERYIYNVLIYIMRDWLVKEKRKRRNLWRYH